MTSEFAMVIAYGRSSGMGRRCGWHENMTGYMALRLRKPNIYPAYENAKSLRIIAKAVQLLRKVRLSGAVFSLGRSPRVA